jgi:hypothetical protein
MLGKDLEQGRFGNLSLMLSPHSLNGLVLGPYFTHKGPCLPIALAKLTSNCQFLKRNYSWFETFLLTYLCCIMINLC